MPFPFRYGTEFLVNTATLGSQFDPSITGLAGGGFVVSWRDDSATDGDTSGTAIRAQIYGADGSPLGGEFLVNTTTAGSQLEPSITGLADGGFVVSWRDTSATGGDTAESAIRAQIYGADGSPLGGEFLVNTTTAAPQLQPCITALADGGFVVSWSDESQTGGDTSNAAIRAQIYGADGSPLGGEFLVNTTTLIHQITPSITGLADGGFVVSWTDASATGGDTSGSAIRAQVFGADGSPLGGEVLVNTTTASSQNEPSITGLADGGFVVSWTDASATGGDTTGSAIRAQVFGADGSPLAGEFLVNTTTAGSQFQSSVTTLADGGFVVSWRDDSQTGGDTTGPAIRAQVFNADGSPLGGEILVNTTTAGSQFQSSVTVLADGRFVISWADSSATGGDTDGNAVRAQIFDPRVTAVHLNGSLLDDDYVGTRYGDEIAGFLGDDSLQGGGGDDDLFGEMGNDTLRGGTGNDRVYGDVGDDLLVGNNGNDQLYGGSGTDVLNGGFGLDYMAGGINGDIYFVDNAGDVVVELASQGKDSVRSLNLDLDLANYANVENIKLLGTADLDATGSAVNNVIVGNDGANVLRGLAGLDNLLGGAGADTLDGGLGRDLMTGGTEADVFRFTSIADSGTTNATRDVVKDFSQGEGDVIDLSAIDAGIAPGNQAFSFIGTAAFPGLEGAVRYFQNGVNTFVQADLDGDGAADFELRLDGLHDLTVSDFIL